MTEIGHDHDVAPTRRAIVGAATKALIPQETRLVAPDGLPKATKHVEDGGGLIVAFTHMSKREGADVITWLLRQPVLKTRPIVSPVSYHTYDRMRAGYEVGAWLTGIKLHPVVTPETLQKLPDQAKQLRERGLLKYVKSATQTLGEGGIVPLALQAQGESKTLGEPTRVLSGLVGALQVKGVENWGVLFVGVDFFDPKAAREALHGLNTGRKARMNVGEFFTGSQVMDKVGRDIKSIDPWAFQNLAGLMPPSYSQPKIAPVGSSPR